VTRHLALPALDIDPRDAAALARLHALRVAVEGLRGEVADIAHTLDCATPARLPVRMEQHDDGPLRHWSTCGDVTEVFTIGGGEDGAGSVFLSAGRRMQWGCDWTALSVDEARALGTALLAAATDAARTEATP
jgi:hypothetical protein